MLTAQDARAAFFEYCDSCTFLRCHFVHDGGANTYGLVMNATNNPGFPVGHVFHDCSIKNTTVSETANNKIGDNYFIGHGVYDNEVIPTHPRLKGVTVAGNVFNAGVNVFVAAPGASNSPGLPGQMAATTTHLYVYTGNGVSHSWRRTALSTW